MLSVQTQRPSEQSLRQTEEGEQKLERTATNSEIIDHLNRTVIANRDRWHRWQRRSTLFLGRCSRAYHSLSAHRREQYWSRSDLAFRWCLLANVVRMSTKNGGFFLFLRLCHQSSSTFITSSERSENRTADYWQTLNRPTLPLLCHAFNLIPLLDRKNRLSDRGLRLEYSRFFAGIGVGLLLFVDLHMCLTQ